MRRGGRRKGRDRGGEGIGEGKERGREGKGGEGIWLPPLPCPLTLSCPPNAEFLDPPMRAIEVITEVKTKINNQ